MINKNYFFKIFSLYRYNCLIILYFNCNLFIIYKIMSDLKPIINNQTCRSRSPKSLKTYQTKIDKLKPEDIIKVS
jgi:hypothetical protein